MLSNSLEINFATTPPHLPFSSGMPINTGVTEGEVLLKHLPDTSPNTSPQHPTLSDSDIRYQFYNERDIIKNGYRIQNTVFSAATYNL